MMTSIGFTEGVCAKYLLALNICNQQTLQQFIAFGQGLAQHLNLLKKKTKKKTETFSFILHFYIYINGFKRKCYVRFSGAG